MPTILRVPKSLEITASLDATIRKLLGDTYTIEPYSHEPDLLHSYQQRITSLFEAFDFLCEAIPPGGKLTKLRTYLEWCHQHCVFEFGWTAEEYQAKLAQFTLLLVDAVANLWNLNPEESIERLDKAEQYLLLQKTRPQYATLAKTGSDGTNLVLIVDKPLAPFTEKTLDELKQIKASDLRNPSLSTFGGSQSSFQLGLFDDDAFEDMIPDNWFSYLPDAEKKLLYHTLQGINLENSETAILLSSRLRTIPGLANFAQHQMHLIDATTGERTKTFEPQLRSSHIGSRDVMKHPVAIHELHTQRNFQRLYACANQIKPSSPGPLLIQTLISPISDFISPDYSLEQQRTYAVAYAKSNGASVFSTNHPYNYARIIYSTPKDSSECLEILLSAQKHLNAVEAQAQPPKDYILALSELISEYQKTLTSGKGTAYLLDWNGRELFLSSLEDILVSYLGGVSYGSCVSGKDRKAIQLIHTNATLLYHAQYGLWPSYTDSGQTRENFVQIFAQLYRSHHYQLFSGQNAPGSDGIKTPEGYLTADISSAIQSRALTLDDRLASNNEVEKIISAGKVSANYPRCIMSACQLNPTQRQSLLTRLKIIVSQEEFWHAKTTAKVPSFVSYVPSLFKRLTHQGAESSTALPNTEARHTMPDGITKIYDILSDSFEAIHSPSESESIKKLADIYDVIIERGSNMLRQGITENFYTTLENLINKPGSYTKTYQDLGEIKQLTFKKGEAASAASPQ